uniref:Uncharacterized protein n=1 Tax=Spironucleus salmonicida TaxID=348837 RepID=V6LWB2_9EUKA|eukprot:EST48917.1 Hypothetical protein SS50377_10842 [Spironucleus salmonicida]
MHLRLYLTARHLQQLTQLLALLSDTAVFIFRPTSATVQVFDPQAGGVYSLASSFLFSALDLAGSHPVGVRFSRIFQLENLQDFDASFVLTQEAGDKPFLDARFFQEGSDFAEHAIEAKLQVPIGFLRNQSLNAVVQELQMVEDGLGDGAPSQEFQLFARAPQLFGLLVEGDETVEVAVLHAEGVKTLQLGTQMSQVSASYAQAGEGAGSRATRLRAVQEALRQHGQLGALLGVGWNPSVFVGERRLVLVLKREAAARCG